MKRKMLIGIVAVILLAFGAGAAATKADFNGVWTLDADKNQGLPPGFTQTMTITQTGDRVNVESMIKVGDGNENVFKDIYILNGEENDFIPPVPENARKKAKRVSQWTDDETGFDATEEAVFTAPSGSEVTVRAKRRWRLSADGKTLTYEMDVENPNGTSKSRRVFVRK